MFFRQKRLSAADPSPFAAGIEQSQAFCAGIAGTMAQMGQSPEARPRLDLPMFRAPKGKFQALGAIIDAIYKALYNDPAVRELLSDFLTKLDYLDLVSNGLLKLMEEIKNLPHDDVQAYLENVARLVREFIAFEACFADVKSLDSWNRLKGTAAGKLTAKQFEWLSLFYAKFPVFAAFCTATTKELAELIEAMAKLLAKDGKPMLLEALKIASDIGRSLQRLLLVLADFYTELANKAA